MVPVVDTAAGGGDVGRGDRSAAQMAKGAGTTAEVKSLLIAESWVRARDINVDTHNRIVSLQGTVSSREQSALA